MTSYDLTDPVQAAAAIRAGVVHVTPGPANPTIEQMAEELARAVRELYGSPVKESLTTEQPNTSRPTGLPHGTFVGHCTNNNQPRLVDEQPEDGATGELRTTFETWAGGIGLPLARMGTGYREVITNVAWTSVEALYPESVKAERDVLAAKVAEMKAHRARTAVKNLRLSNHITKLEALVEQAYREGYDDALAEHYCGQWPESRAKRSLEDMQEGKA